MGVKSIPPRRRGERGEAAEKRGGRVAGFSPTCPHSSLRVLCILCASVAVLLVSVNRCQIFFRQLSRATRCAAWPALRIIL